MSKPNPVITTDNLQHTIRAVFKQLPHKGVLYGVRKLSKGRPGKCITLFNSHRNQALMPCESNLEVKNCLALEFNRSVVNYRTQPFTLKIGSNQKYTPDTVHIDSDGLITVTEVKFSGALNNKKLLAQLNAIDSVLGRENIKFDIKTELELERNPQLFNRNFLYRGARIPMTSQQISYALTLLNQYKKTTLSNFQRYCESRQLPACTVERLLFLGLAHYDSQIKITPHSMISVKGRNL